MIKKVTFYIFLFLFLAINIVIILNVKNYIEIVNICFNKNIILTNKLYAIICFIIVLISVFIILDILLVVFKKKDDKYYPFVSGSYGTFVKDGVAYQYPVFQKKGGMEYIYTYDKKDLLIKECRKMVNGHLESENLAKVFQMRYLGGTIETESNYPILFKLVSGIVSDSYVLSTGNYSEMIEKIKIRKNKDDEFDRIESSLSIVIKAKEEN